LPLPADSINLAHDTLGPLNGSANHRIASWTVSLRCPEQIFWRFEMTRNELQSRNGVLRKPDKLDFPAFADKHRHINEGLGCLRWRTSSGGTRTIHHPPREAGFAS
jgi:hypothetical protein